MLLVSRPAAWLKRFATAGLLPLLLLSPSCRPDPGGASPRSPHEGYVNVPGGRIWYEVVGTGPGTPLLLIHGGPGGRSCGFAPLKALGRERPVILYDQLGGGRSDRPADTTLWQLPRFLDEIDSLRARLNLKELHLYGHSWGATVAAEYYLSRHPAGIRSITLAGPLLSTPRWIEDARLLRAQLPEALQRVLAEHETAGTFNAPEYQAATDSFYARHLRRHPTIPRAECEGVRGNDAIYRYMWGPTEFVANGTLRSYDATPRLAGLDRPVLLLCGEFDEARPETVREFQRMIPGARFEMIPNAGHSILNDAPARLVDVLREFLREVEGE